MDARFEKHGLTTATRPYTSNNSIATGEINGVAERDDSNGPPTRAQFLGALHKAGVMAQANLNAIYANEAMAFGGAAGGALLGLGLEALQASRALQVGEWFNAGKGLLGGEAKMSLHAAEQAIDQQLTKAEIAEALSHVAKQEAGRGNVIQFFGKVAQVRVNRVTGTIVTVIRMTRAGL